MIVMNDGKINGTYSAGLRMVGSNLTTVSGGDRPAERDHVVFKIDTLSVWRSGVHPEAGFIISDAMISGTSSNESMV